MVTNDTDAIDWVSEDISLSDLWPYTLPDTPSKRSGYKRRVLGQFFKWIH